MAEWVVGSRGPVGPNAAATVDKLLKPLAESVEETLKVTEVATVLNFDEKDAVIPKSFKVKKLIHRCLFERNTSVNDGNLGDYISGSKGVKLFSGSVC